MDYLYNALLLSVSQPPNFPAGGKDNQDTRSFRDGKAEVTDIALFESVRACELT